MAAQDFDATSVPRDIVGALNLKAGQRYACQNVSTTATLYFRSQIRLENDARPAVTDRAFRIEAGGNFRLKPEAGIVICLWTADPAGCPVVVDDAA